MFRIKRFFHVAWVSALTVLGIYQYDRDPVIDHEPPSVITQGTPVPISTHLSHPVLEQGAITGATEQEASMISVAINRANIVLAGDCFKNAILDGKFTSTNGLTNAQIYDVFLKEKKRANVEMFYGSFMQNYIYKTMGIDKGNGIVYANRFFIKDPHTLASLILHEAVGHGNGFSHKSASESTSIPYSLNAIYDKCIGQ